MNPFSYGKEVTGYQFYDRKEACEDLYHTLKDGSANVVLSVKGVYGIVDPFFARYVRTLSAVKVV